MAFCTNCGHHLVDGAKFCFECGAKVDISTVSHDEARKTMYDGEIHKCPNCGDILDAHELVCEACGWERRGSKATTSVQELQLRLETLYSKRPPRKMRSVFAYALSGGQVLTNEDEEIVSLIKNFPIPNNKEDIMEFAILASSNIDVKVYDSLEGQRYQLLNPAQREISDAWLAKFEQAKQKAEIMFGHTPEYLSVRNVYENKMKTIKKQKLKRVWLLLGVFGFFFLMVAFIVILALTGSL
jgi:hypothetical protein